MGQEGDQGQKQDQAAMAMPIPELQEEDWDQDLTFLTPPIDWEQAVSQTTAMEEGEANVMDDKGVEIHGEEATAGAMPEAGVVRVEEVEIHGDEATVRAMPEADVVKGQDVKV